MSLKGKVAVVTGGASGIGRAISQRLARDGASVAVWDLNGEGAAETAKMIADENGVSFACTVDASDELQIRDAAKKTRGALGPVTILVNNAAMSGFCNILDITSDMWDKMMRVNLRGPFFCVQTFLPDMLAAGLGRIVNISSSSAQQGAHKMSHYAASKGGIIGFTKALALELAETGITVNNVPPGFVDTPMLRAAPIDIDEYAKGRPMKRAGKPEDIAAACAYLVSEDAGYVTGQTISVNGGTYMV